MKANVLLMDVTLCKCILCSFGSYTGCPNKSGTLDFHYFDI